MKLLLFTCLVTVLMACGNNDHREDAEGSAPTFNKDDYIKPIAGKNDTLDKRSVQRGNVLVAYSDCRTCHSIDKKAKGPAFHDIAQRYPANNAYIELLAHKIRAGGSGAWGNSVMEPHPEVSIEDARLMAKYILSLKVPE